MAPAATEERESVEARLAGQLQAVAAGAFDDASVEVRGLHQLTGGASRQTWAFDVHRAGAPVTPLILRRDPPSAIRPGGMLAEALAFTAARRAGVPEPAIVAHDDDPAALDAPYIVMERIEGETVPRRILREDAFADVRPRLAGQCGEILARIHAIPPAELQAAGVAYQDPVESLRTALASFAEPRPVLELGLRWLEAHRPAANPPAVVHGDFRHGNLLIGPDGIRAVLDWELVHLGDPMEDLGYLCVRAWRFGADAPVGGFGAYDELFAGYERGGGRPVDPELVRWWEVVGTLRWGVGCMAQAGRHLSGQERAVELAAIGRRTVEQEYDLLLLIEDRLEGL